MSQVLVWKSDEDGKLFEDRAKYTAHLRKLGAKRREAKRVEQYQIDREAFFDRMGQVADFAELQQFIIDNWEQFRINSRVHNSWRKQSPNSTADQLINLKLHELRFETKSHNSHSAPRDGISNFDSRNERNQGRPTSYAGWRGRITYTVTSTSSFGSDYFAGTPICTGSGGGGSPYSYDLTLWAADFPVIWEKHCRAEWVKNENAQRDHVWHQVGGSGSAVHVTECPPDWVLPDALQGTSFYEGQTYK